MVKKLTKVGNSQAALLDKTVMEIAGLRDGDQINITATPGAVVITPVERHVDDERFDAAASKVLKKRAKLLKRLA